METSNMVFQLIEEAKARNINFSIKMNYCTMKKFVLEQRLLTEEQLEEDMVIRKISGYDVVLDDRLGNEEIVIEEL